MSISPTSANNPIEDIEVTGAGQLLTTRTLEHACLLSLGLVAHSARHVNPAIGASHLG